MGRCQYEARLSWASADRALALLASGMMMQILGVIVGVTLLVLQGCAPLPKYAMPHMVDYGGESVPWGNVPYRHLTVDDFKAAVLPERVRGYGSRLQAHSAIRIRPSARSVFRVTARSAFDQIVYCGVVEKLVLEAVFLSNHSWWNPAVPADKRGYVLQHEQIHFALMEIFAREMTRQLEEAPVEVVVYGSSEDEVQQQLAEHIGSLIESKNEEIVQQHTAFDIETSGKYAPVVQQRWQKKVRQRLLSH